MKAQHKITKYEWTSSNEGIQQWMEMRDGRQIVCYYNQILLRILHIIEFLRMCRGCWDLCLHLITMSWNEISRCPSAKLPVGGWRGRWQPSCGLEKVRPLLCSSIVKCSFLITELLPLWALQSYSYQSPVFKAADPKSIGIFNCWHLWRRLAGDGSL